MFCRQKQCGEVENPSSFKRKRGFGANESMDRASVFEGVGGGRRDGGSAGVVSKENNEGDLI